jgi:hypothetical protein
MFCNLYFVRLQYRIVWQNLQIRGRDELVFTSGTSSLARMLTKGKITCSYSHALTPALLSSHLPPPHAQEGILRLTHMQLSHLPRYGQPSCSITFHPTDSPSVPVVHLRVTVSKTVRSAAGYLGKCIAAIPQHHGSAIIFMRTD